MVERRPEFAPLTCQGESTPAQQHIRVAPMRYGEIPRSADSMHRAFLSNPITAYNRVVDTAPFLDVRWKIRQNMTLLDAVIQGRVLSVNQGDALLIYGAPGSNQTSKIYNFFFDILQRFNTDELNARKSEFRVKIQKMVQTAFGEKAKDMYYIHILGTAPEAQGRGYASALVNAVTAMADVEGRDTWLITADATPFYERLGFAVVQEDSLGAENPNWSSKPVSICIMLRTRRHSELST
ncbi:hypothetical protein ONZ51_g1359 [Trametes cubensis]|uniref:N-acetyltransferase domain-containing protein n=1 Tax=Trametes cubensis TaxID=1111947 RepID=A0AAD7XEY8_9APHY|nr:hypothetical protein ONZ51_g1359 [Trametes cubensis]